MNKTFFTVFVIVLCFAFFANARDTRVISDGTSSGFRVSRPSRAGELIDLGSAAEQIYTPILDLNEFIPLIPDENIVPGAYDYNYPEDEEVSSIPAENDIIIDIPINISAQRLTTFTPDRIYNDERIVSLDTPLTSRTSSTSTGSRSGATGGFVESTGGTRGGESSPGGTRGQTSGGTRGGETTTTTGGTRPTRGFVDGDSQIPPRTGGGVRQWSDPSSQVSDSCTAGPCAGIQTSLNLSTLGNTFRQLVSPILSAFNNKNFVIRNSWPHVDMTIVTVDLSAVNISSSYGRVNVQLVVSAVGKLHVRTKLLGSATTTFSVMNYNLSAGANIQIQNEKIAVASISSSASYSDLSIHTTGGLIMKFIIKVAATILKVKTLARNILTGDVPNAIQGALSTAALRMVGTVPWKVRVGKWGAGLSLNVVGLDTTTQNVVKVSFSGETVNYSTGLPFPHTTPTRHGINLVHNPTHLFNVMIDEYSINDYLSTWFSQQNHETIYNKSTRPQWLTDLDTFAWNLIFPGIGDQHPNSNLVMKIDLDSAPTIAIANGIAQFTTLATATWAIDNGMGYIGEPLVSISLQLQAGLAMTMKYDQINQYYALIPTITNLTPNFTASMTMIGPINLDLVNSTLQNILNYVIVPLVDIILLDGIPIPTTQNFQVINPVITFTNNAVLIGTGVNINF